MLIGYNEDLASKNSNGHRACTFYSLCSEILLNIVQLYFDWLLGLLVLLLCELNNVYILSHFPATKISKNSCRKPRTRKNNDTDEMGWGVFLKLVAKFFSFLSWFDFCASFSFSFYGLIYLLIWCRPFIYLHTLVDIFHFFFFCDLILQKCECCWLQFGYFKRQMYNFFSVILIHYSLSLICRPSFTMLCPLYVAIPLVFLIEWFYYMLIGSTWFLNLWFYL